MKHRYLFRTCGSLFLLLCAFSCSRSDGDEECLSCRKVRSVNVRLAADAPASNLVTPLYLFRRAAGSQDAYLFSRSYPAVLSGQSLKLSLAELKAYDFRFLGLAQPADDTWLTLRTADGTPLVPGTAWEDVRLVSATGAAQADGYSGFTDARGVDLLASERVALTLARIAGQAVFAFFRIGDSLAQPAGVVSQGVESVIDRVSRIEVTYENPTTALRFEADGSLTPSAYAAQPFRQTIEPLVTDYKVALPQPDKGLTVYDEQAKGSLRIAGAFLLPSASKLRVGMVFTYFDTTLSCGNPPVHTHSESCYSRRQVSLQLPKADAPDGLPVSSDCYTVSRAGLRCDRIIDIPAGGDVEADFTWLNGKEPTL